MMDQPPVKSADRLLLKAATVARVLDIDISTVYKLMQDGRLPSVKIEGMNTPLVPQHVLHAWVRNLVKAQIGELK